MQVELELNQPSSKTHSIVIFPPQYSISKDKPRREVRPPHRFGEADLVAYDLNMDEDIDVIYVLKGS